MSVYIGSKKANYLYCGGTRIRKVYYNNVCYFNDTVTSKVSYTITNSTGDSNFQFGFVVNNQIPNLHGIIGQSTGGFYNEDGKSYYFAMCHTQSSKAVTIRFSGTSGTGANLSCTFSGKKTITVSSNLRSSISTCQLGVLLGLSTTGENKVNIIITPATADEAGEGSEIIDDDSNENQDENEVIK